MILMVIINIKLDTATDAEVWDYACDNNYFIVSQDTDLSYKSYNPENPGFSQSSMTRLIRNGIILLRHLRMQRKQILHISP